MKRYVLTVQAIGADGSATDVLSETLDYRQSSAGKPMLFASRRTRLADWDWQTSCSITAVQPTIKGDDGVRVPDPNRPTPSFDALRAKL